MPYAVGQMGDAVEKLQAANYAVKYAFNAVLDAERAGANVTDLLNQLNDAAGIFAQAVISCRNGDPNTTSDKADSALAIAERVTTAAQDARQTALVSGQNAFWSTLAFTVIGAFAFVLILLLVWRRFKRKYVKNLSAAKPEVNIR